MISLRRRPLILGSILVPWLVAPRRLAARQPMPPASHAGIPATAGDLSNFLALGLSDSGMIVGQCSLDVSTDAGFATRWDKQGVTRLAPLPGDVRAAALDINDAGLAVGISISADGSWHAARWDNGEVTALLPDDLTGFASGINATGQIVGAAERADGTVSTAVLWENGGSTMLPPLPGDTDSQAWQINDAGQVVGQSWDEETGRAVRWDGDEPIAPGELPGHTWSLARSINNAGQVVGWLGDLNDHIQPVLWTDGEAVPLGSTSRDIVTQGRAFDINEQGEVVGYIVTDRGAQRAAFWRGGELIDLGTLLGDAGSTALAINDAGRIVGWSGSADADLARAVRWNDGEIVALTEPVVIAALDPFAFVPTEVTVTPGQEVIVVNTGLSQHDLVVDEWSIATDLLEGGGQAFFTIPDDAEVGTVVPFYCPVPGHRENGMEGTFAIVEGGAAAPVEEGAESTPADAGAVPAEPIVLEAQDPFQWSSNDISAAPGQVIEVTNAGLLEHDFVVDELGISEPLPAGEVVEVTIPADAPVGDTYVFYCSIPGHRESGMEGALTIIEPSQVSSQTSNASLTEEALTGLLPASDQMPNNLTDSPDSGRDRDPPAARSGRPRVSHGR